jgi:hypothetical protein
MVFYNELHSKSIYDSWAELVYLGKHFGYIPRASSKNYSIFASLKNVKEFHCFALSFRRTKKQNDDFEESFKKMYINLLSKWYVVLINAKTKWRKWYGMIV